MRWMFAPDEARELRTEAGLSQAELAQMAGMSRQTVQYYESGRIDPGMMRAAQIAGALGVTILEVGGFSLDATEEEMRAFESAVLEGRLGPGSFDGVAGADVRAARKAKGWSQKRLAREAGCTYETVCAFETGRGAGKNGIRKPKRLAEMCVALGISPAPAPVA